MSSVRRHPGPAGRAAAGHPRAWLIEERRDGYPREYLLSRIRGRRSKLIRLWRTLLLGGPPAEHLSSSQYEGFVRERTLDGMWRSLLREHQWVFGQMGEALRKDLASYLLYVELRTIMLCLRFRSGDRVQQAAEVLVPSLLSRQVKALLLEGDVRETLERLEEMLVRLSPRFSGLAGQYGEDLRAVERHLTDTFLSVMAALPLRPVVHGLFVRLIDARNMIALSRSLRTGPPDPSLFIDGGSIEPARLTSLGGREDPYAVLPLLRQAMGITVSEPEPSRVETALYRGITRYLRTEGRDPLGTGVVLEYLWRCSLEITNLSLLFAGKELEREELAAELVY